MYDGLGLYHVIGEYIFGQHIRRDISLYLLWLLWQ